MATHVVSFNIKIQKTQAAPHSAPPGVLTTIRSSNWELSYAYTNGVTERPIQISCRVAIRNEKQLELRRRTQSCQQNWENANNATGKAISRRHFQHFGNKHFLAAALPFSKAALTLTDLIKLSAFKMNIEVPLPSSSKLEKDGAIANC